MMSSGDREFVKQLQNELDNAIQTFLGDSRHSLYYRLYDEMADVIEFTDAGANPKYKDLVFMNHFYYLAFSKEDRALFHLEQFALEFDLVIHSSVGLFILKCKCLICQDPHYGLVGDVIDFKVESLVPEP